MFWLDHPVPTKRAITVSCSATEAERPIFLA
jgi:hypothetical protein